MASGGELSRLALAIAVTHRLRDAARARAPTLIFDEIDAGIGGSVADTVGRLMKQLGRERQVLAVTHLAQVAACADHHFVVTKALQGTATRQRRAAGGRRGARRRGRAHARRRAAGRHQPAPMPQEMLGGAADARPTAAARARKARARAAAG